MSVIQCRDVQCTLESHRDEADSFMISILNSVENAAFKSLPVSNAQMPHAKLKKTTIPGWSYYVKPFKEKAVFWNAVWKSAGKPLNCELHTIMKRTRNEYHYQIRKVKKYEDMIRKHKLLDACFNGDSDIFTEIKKIRRHTPQITTVIDGKEGNISEHFKDMYKKF